MGGKQTRMSYISLAMTLKTEALVHVHVQSNILNELTMKW